MSRIHLATRVKYVFRQDMNLTRRLRHRGCLQRTEDLYSKQRLQECSTETLTMPAPTPYHRLSPLQRPGAKRLGDDDTSTQTWHPPIFRPRPQLNPIAWRMPFPEFFLVLCTSPFHESGSNPQTCRAVESIIERRKQKIEKRKALAVVGLQLVA